MIVHAHHVKKLKHFDDGDSDYDDDYEFHTFFHSFSYFR